MALPADTARVRVNSLLVFDLHPELSIEDAVVAYLHFEPLEVHCGSAEDENPPGLARPQRSLDPRDHAGDAVPRKLKVWERCT